MVCHRWTLALILLTVPLLVTVISAFRVRLPGSSHEVKSDFRRHKCEDCDVSDSGLDPVSYKLKKESVKRLDDVKKILKDKRLLIEEKLGKTSFDSEDNDDEDDERVLEKATLENVKLKTDSEKKIKGKKPSLVLDFDDDDDSDIEDDDEYDEPIPKSAKEEPEAKKKTEFLSSYKDIKLLPKIKTKDKDESKVDDYSDEEDKKQRLKEQIPVRDLKAKTLQPKDIIKENLKSKEKPLKVKDSTGDDKEVKSSKVLQDGEKLKSKTEYKIKENLVKESISLKPILEKKALKDDIQVKGKQLDNKEIKIEKKPEKSIKITIPKVKKQLSPPLEETKTDLDETQDKENVTKRLSTDNRVQHLSEALLRRNLLQSEFEDFYAFLPTFAPNFSRIHNPECRRHGQILLRQLRGSKLWALNMLDATAKIPSGLLQGNGVQLGDFDQCLGVRARVQLDTGSVVKIQGKYCLAMIDVKAEQPELEMAVHLAQAKNLFKSRIDDPGHFVPRVSTLSWGICVPSPCGPEDVEVVLRDAIKHYQYKIGVSVRVKVDEEDCHVKKGPNWWNEWLEIPTLLTISLYAIVLILVLIATLQDFLARNISENDNARDGDGKKEEKSKNNKKSHGIISSFSLYNTFGKLVAPVSKNEISCIHGLRAIATLAILFAHKFLPVGVTPYTNRLRLSEIVSSPLLSWCRAGWMFTDCFLLLSGTLTSYRKSTDEAFAAKLLSRYLRLTPALAAIVFFYAYIWDNISSGPMWGTLVTKNVEICQKGWWWNLLYIQNYHGLENMCAPQTHHMALDFQLTILGGIIVWAIQYEVPFSSFVMPILHLSSAYSRYNTYKNHRLTILAYQGVSVSQLYRTGRLSYTSVFHRCTSYLVGIRLGLALRTPATHSKILNIMGWFICGTLMGLVLWAGADSGYLDYHYDVTFSALYATLAPIATALAFSWFIYAVHNGQSNILSRLLSCRPLLFISRISYALYLIQFIVFLTNTATIRASKEFSLMSMFDLEEISTILLSSILLTVTLVIPLQSLPKISSIFKSNEIEDTPVENSKSDPIKNKLETEKKDDNEVVREVPQIKRSFIAHREVLEEIPEVEVEYEIQREAHEGLEEILEEDDTLEEEQDRLDEDLEIIEEEQGEEDLEEDFWADRGDYLPRRSLSNNQDVDEWEWTANGNETGSRNFQYRR
ncbi:unnamed protein product, partial [Brenthis ino]